ncbi:hypothetical protein Celaphus_00004028, partial [Cervus elaphus hippelaphus]
HCGKAKAVVIPHTEIKTLKEFNRNKKPAKKNDVVLASERLAGSLPCGHNENTEAKVDEVKSRIKFQMEMVLGLAVAAGPVEMTEEELGHNIHLAINFLVSLLKKN